MTERGERAREAAREASAELRQRAREAASQASAEVKRIGHEIAAQPPPRKVKGLIAPTFGVVFAWPYRAALRGLLALRLTGDHLTALSVATNLAIAVMLARGMRFLPGILLVPAGLFDIFDGAVARARGRSSSRGAWLDSTGDRVAEAAVLGGLFWSLAQQGEDLQAGLSLIALVVSLVVSFTRAQAQALGGQMGEGMFSRLERSVALMVGLTQPGALIYALWALVVLGGITLVQRLWQARSPLVRAGDAR